MNDEPKVKEIEFGETGKKLLKLRPVIDEEFLRGTFAAYERTQNDFCMGIPVHAPGMQQRAARMVIEIARLRAQVNKDADALAYIEKRRGEEARKNEDLRAELAEARAGEAALAGLLKSCKGKLDDWNAMAKMVCASGLASSIDIRDTNFLIRGACETLASRPEAAKRAEAVIDLCDAVRMGMDQESLLVRATALRAAFGMEG